jgi:hypothetical protein
MIIVKGWIFCIFLHLHQEVSAHICKSEEKVAEDGLKYEFTTMYVDIQEVKYHLVCR